MAPSIAPASPFVAAMPAVRVAAERLAHDVDERCDIGLQATLRNGVAVELRGVASSRSMASCTTSRPRPSGDGADTDELKRRRQRDSAPCWPTSKRCCWPAKAGNIYRSLPELLPCEQCELHPATSTAHHDAAGQSCGGTACGGRPRGIDADVSEHLEDVPARFEVIRRGRPKPACTKCEAVFQASAQSRPITRGLAGPALLAHVTVSKYCDHSPLHRQSRIYARESVDIEPSTMAGWVEQVHTLFAPLVAALGRHVLHAAKVTQRTSR